MRMLARVRPVNVLAPAPFRRFRVKHHLLCWLFSMKTWNYFTFRSWDKSKNPCPWEISTIFNERGEGLIHHEAEGRVMDHAFAAELKIVPILPRAWVLAFIPRPYSLFIHKYIHLFTNSMTNSRNRTPTPRLAALTALARERTHWKHRRRPHMNSWWIPAQHSLTGPSVGCPSYIMSFHRSIHAIYAK